MSPSDSELSDMYDQLIEDSDSEIVPVSTSTRAPPKKKASQDQEYKLQKVLKPPRATTYAAKALYDQIHNASIDLSPEYQRDVVWNENKQINLIDSICRNFYVPPIIFAVTVERDGTERRVCIDGKQRLTSIRRFMDGLIPFRDSFTGQKFWFKDTETASAREKKLLPESVRKIFSNRQIVCVEYVELTHAEERDIFKRVQQGEALRPDEKLGIVSTSRTAFIRELLQLHVPEGSFGKIPWTTTRGTDFSVFARAVYCIETWFSSPANVNPYTSLTFKTLEAWLAGGGELPRKFQAQVRETFELLMKLATNQKYSEPFYKYKKVAPVEMVFIALLIFVHGVLPSPESRLSKQALSAQISEMRVFVRQEFPDRVRMNDHIGKKLVEYIKDIERKPASTPQGPAKFKRKWEDSTASAEQLLASKHSSSRRKLLTPESPTFSTALEPSTLYPKIASSPRQK
ncbi:hypothetical protein GYMLUDRAFT_264172 [Collybiopsis luxurians FD-317 M1]|uniref:GmrSD restriction endonucleases N-terminal domain-containing protein n=1 Tax=Collybiopsis luxurians FD-317 M1 TaxID=944289 RepID=A0A0D0AXJ9_9AGAR|nr:hypothetical protein GYMLUDRAFT_264172 [Collybiopsis luxurians FD-317 M1]